MRCPDGIKCQRASYGATLPPKLEYVFSERPLTHAGIYKSFLCCRFDILSSCDRDQIFGQLLFCGREQPFRGRIANLVVRRNVVKQSVKRQLEFWVSLQVRSLDFLTLLRLQRPYSVLHEKYFPKRTVLGTSRSLGTSQLTTRAFGYE